MGRAFLEKLYSAVLFLENLSIRMSHYRRDNFLLYNRIKVLLILKQIVYKLETSKISYRITGGIVCDAIRGKWTRQHNNIDIIVAETSLELLIVIFEKLGFKVRHFQPNWFRYHCSGIDINFWAYSPREHYFESQAIFSSRNQCLVRVPDAVFENINTIRFCGLNFAIPCNELLFMTHVLSPSDLDRELLLGLKTSIPITVTQKEIVVDASVNLVEVMNSTDSYSPTAGNVMEECESRFFENTFAETQDVPKTAIIQPINIQESA